MMDSISPMSILREKGRERSRFLCEQTDYRLHHNIYLCPLNCVDVSYSDGGTLLHAHISTPSFA